MKNTGQKLALRHVVRPERWHFAIRGSHPAAEKRYSRSARSYARPGPAPHVKCPIAPRNALGISDSQTRAGSSRGPDSDRSAGPAEPGKEISGGASHSFPPKHREIPKILPGENPRRRGIAIKGDIFFRRLQESYQPAQMILRD